MKKIGYIASIASFAIFALLAWKYINVIQDKNGIERERILLENQVEKDRQYQTYYLRFQADCNEEQDEVIKENNKYINDCTSQNDIQVCQNSQAYKQIFLPKLQKYSGPEWEQKCIAEKMFESRP